jgi:hypothetical protein
MNIAVFCDFQGMFSKSAIVTLSDEREVSFRAVICAKYQVVVQSKDNVIDSPKEM